ncbi:hypothetical protein HY621_00080 [Candidatus Uhrbacteria bacterium]|nr:hypothetical protein [Candidatus Uhrbacteria bacterium]
MEYIDVQSTTIDPTFVRTLLYRYMDENIRVFDQHNILFFTPAAFRAYLSQYAVIDTFSLEKKYPNSLRISLSGSPFHVMGYLEGHFYELTPTGTIAREVDATTLPQYPTLINNALAGERIIIPKSSLAKMDLSFPVIILPPMEQIFVNTHVIDARILNHIETTKRLLRDEKYAILFFRPDPSALQYRAYTHEGWYVIFSTASDATQQTKNLNTLLRTTIKKKRKSLEYVDVRFENKLFYTLKK